MPKVIDANIIIRYLVKDSPQQVKRIKKLIKEGKEKFILTDVTVAEIVWVLQSYYEQSKEEIAEKIISLLDTPVFMADKPLLTRAINYFQEYSLDYIDAYLIAFAQENHGEGILSFDKSIDKVGQVPRLEP